MPNILVTAGEASGDWLGAHLCKAMRDHHSTPLKFFGMGGPLMREQHIETVIDANQLAILGIWEVCKNFSKIKKAFKTIKRLINARKPELVILIDYPAFNLRIAKFAKKQDCKVFFYVSPQIWAWRYNRVKKIKKYVDHIAVLFQFEEKIYRKEQIPVSFVGHPIIDFAKPTVTKESVYKKYQISPTHPVIALFPGSRKQEILHMLPIIIESSRLIKNKLSDAQFILPIANSLRCEDLTPYLPSDIRLITDDIYNALMIADAAIAVSGTVTLEIALQKVLFVIIYKTSRINYWICKYLIHVPYIGLCNLVAEFEIAKEFIQHDANPGYISTEILKLLHNKEYRQKKIKNFERVKQNLGPQNASQCAAESALALLAKDTVYPEISHLNISS